jgi:hypothetical protein
MQIGVTDGLVNRVMATLKFLGLVRDDQTTTEQFRAVRYASDDDYQKVLTGILEAAYKGVLDHIDLATAGDRELNNAFIPYSPGGQRSRMITLFQALAREAGWPLAVEPKASSPRPNTAKPRAPKVKTPRRHDVQTSGGGSLNQETSHEGTAGSGLRLSVTESDLDALDEEEFDQVWDALGLLQKARRRQAQESFETVARHALDRRAEEEEAGE